MSKKKNKKKKKESYGCSDLPEFTSGCCGKIFLVPREPQSCILPTFGSSEFEFHQIHSKHSFNETLFFEYHLN